MDETKTCTGCREGKPLMAFPKHPAGKNGLDSKCRQCKNGARKPTVSRAVRNRARQRATAELVKIHDEEFRDLLDKHTEWVADEMEILRQAAAAERNDDVDVPRLKPGPRAPEDDVIDRLDTARCTECASHHDRGHHCTACGASPVLSTPVAEFDVGDLAEHQLASDRATEECIGCGFWEAGVQLSVNLLCPKCEQPEHVHAHAS